MRRKFFPCKDPRSLLPTPYSPLPILTLFLAFSLFPSCQRNAVPEPVVENEVEFVLAAVSGETAPAQSAWQEPVFILIPERGLPGEPVTIVCNEDMGTRNFLAVLMDSRSRRLTKAFFFNLPLEEQDCMAAILAIPSTAASGDAVIRIESSDGMIKDLPFIIDSRKFASETISLNEDNTALRTVPDPQKTAESEQLWAILHERGKDIFFTGAFTPPVTSTRRTSFYGDRRTYSYVDNTSDTTIHAGIDFGVPTGTPVIACGAGRVVLARPRIVTGNTVVLEHLPGVFSLYYHMDSITVLEGMILETGVLLGRSGSTGLATGPHLHWEIRVSGEYADPDIFLSRPVLDKKDILNRMSNN